MATYTYKQLTVDAVQWRGDNMDEVQAFLEPHGGPWNPQGANAQFPLSVMAGEGPRAVPLNAYIVVDPARGVHVTPAGVFEASMVPAGDAETESAPAKPVAGRPARKAAAGSAASAEPE